MSAFVVVLGGGSAALAQGTSPGPLARSHVKLEGADQCGKCHTPGKGVTDDRCLECHADAKTSRFHGDHRKQSGKDCATCHRDHRGRDFQMIRWKPPTDFDHARTGYKLAGKHADLKCGKCHTKKQRWMGLEAGCVKCHQDRHKPSLGKACDQCHSQLRFDKAEKFDHAKAKFPLRGRHLKVDCAKCHEKAGIEGRFRGLKFAACADCHREPVDKHSGERDCAGCHGNDGWAKVERRAGVDLHARTKMPLRGKHLDVACEKCHTARKTDVGSASDAAARLRLFGGLQTDCAQCHRDPHGRRFGSDCASCHGEADWKLRKPDHFDHDRTHFPLRGGHRAVACKTCHKRVGSYKKRFAGVASRTCQTCHGDPHGGPFQSVEGGDACTGCHSEEAFVPVRYGLDDHKRAAFVVRDSHRVVACRACHKPVAAAPLAGGLLARGSRGREIAQLHGTPQTCRTCHTDPHRGQFDGREPAVDCVSCHSQTAFAAVIFDHDKSRFPLQGIHREVACEKCHTRPAAELPVAFVGAPTACGACHKDAHKGQFESDGTFKRCGDCHTPVKGFRITAFNHAATRFALDGKHQKAACKDCHKRGVGPGGTQAVLWRIGAIDCARCHANPHSERAATVAQRGGAAVVDGSWACARCHNTSGWQGFSSAGVDFDHSQTGVPLSGHHATAACGGCHRPDEQPDGVPRDCASCHADSHRGELGSRCDDCHTSYGWKTPRRFADHDRARLPLTGAHRAIDCRSCHVRRGADVWRGTPATCDACHISTALAVASFDHRRISPGCNTCHSTFAWAPARMNHDVFWPLVGGHAVIATQCNGCHIASSFAAATRACSSCHMSLVVSGQTHPDHQAMGFPTTCERCHTPLGWHVMNAGWHEDAFPIDSGDHKRYAGTCQSCHPSGMGPGRFDCIHCHDGTHSQAQMNGEHDDVGGYVWDNHACLSCHPKG